MIVQVVFIFVHEILPTMQARFTRGPNNVSYAELQRWKDDWTNRETKTIEKLVNMA